MKITLDEWVELEKLAREAKAALERLERATGDLSFEHHSKGNTAEFELLRKTHDRVFEANGTLAASLFHVQSEWTGGDSSDPKNHTLREPNLVTISHSFPKDQVDKYRGPDGDIRIPHRGQK